MSARLRLCCCPVAHPHFLASLLSFHLKICCCLFASPCLLQVYKVSPGSQTYPLSDQEQTRAAAGAVAGAKHQVKGGGPARSCADTAHCVVYAHTFKHHQPVHNPVCSIAAFSKYVDSCPAARVTYSLLLLSQFHLHPECLCCCLPPSCTLPAGPLQALCRTASQRPPR
jgi:hypothetical protein